MQLIGTPHRALTTSTGAFAIHAVPAGRYRVLVRHVGFDPVTLRAIIAGPDTVDADVVLHHTVAVLGGVSVTATGDGRVDLTDFEANRKLGFGTFFTRKEIDAHSGSLVSTLLPAKVSGLNLMPRKCGGSAVASGTAFTSLGVSNFVGRETNCLMPDLCYLQLYVDGQQIFRTDHVSAPPNIDEYRLGEVEAVELYLHGGATPARYNSLGSACGTLVLWRRR